ncbi:hypothetical protein BO82DRAFT_45350 [Aspergillus uvarum CBS 121591]|uniref:Uncharacterized protein n=1 Tax=Aspergillus uvarum CBS 121591 TaxID=1448315 RepID=A0A319CF57_9EURO|nr:hypothetical protein BO82DRAFT_45350 [Aspergillus uvarum CBS 121591]PYH83070.1 hypothetical protein BO82DRAFT_45350 [Aspergillus uvarum CBS 121591]
MQQKANYIATHGSTSADVLRSQSEQRLSLVPITTILVGCDIVLLQILRFRLHSQFRVK